MSKIIIFTKTCILKKLHEFHKMKKRENQGYSLMLIDFIKFDIWVVCPKCSKKALVFTMENIEGAEKTKETKFVCSSCGLNKKLTENPIATTNYSNYSKGKSAYLTLGGDVDPFFQLPLWLRVEVEGNVLWAYNPQHLKFLSEYIEANLRERNQTTNSNQSLGSRLPKWMTSKKNRDLVIKKIRCLEKNFML
jgi:transcription elongation factor Elf1